MAGFDIRLQRSRGVEGFQSSQSLSTDALNGMLSIPGVEHPEILCETEDEVTLSYRWSGNERFWMTDEYLARFGLCRADWSSRPQ